MMIKTEKDADKELVMGRTAELARQLEESGFSPGRPSYNAVTKSACVHVQEFFDGIWQTGVEVTRAEYYVYRLLEEPLLPDECYPDNDITIDFVANAPSKIIGYLSMVLKMMK